MSTRMAGILLLAGGAVFGLIILAWLASGVADDESGLRMSGAILGGGVLLLVIVGPMLIGGTLLFKRGSVEDAQLAVVRRQRTLLGIIESAGQISISDLALQVRGTRDGVRDDIYDLVSKGLFTGYIDWNRNMLYARQASQLREGRTCPNCGGEVNLAGKGIVRCGFCGAEIFLT